MAKNLFKLFLALALLAFAAGCAKKMSDGDKNKIYSEGMTAYTAQDYATALTKFKTIADQGDARAQFNVGVMHHQGQGVALDDKEAITWWTKAAEQGHAEAQDNIGLRYGKGQGVAMDWVQAYKWFGIAAAGGNQTAQGNMQAAAARMTPDQIQQAQKLIAEWQDKHKK
ncbi:MAG: sel1 repeat family protein [Nitrosomonadales bacterium]|nr:sel1 repeat family protein [Nitrosomonadales bacterium]